MDGATRRSWKAELARNRSKTLDAPSWLWLSVVELMASHEAAVTLGTKPESSALGLRSKDPVGCNRNRVRPHALIDQKNLAHRVLSYVSRRSPGCARSHRWAGLRLTPECQLAMTSKPGMEIGGSSEVARLYQ
jgi:hypothetical protein